MPRNPMPQHGQSSASSLAQLAPAWFAKATPQQCCIIKTSANTARVRGASIVVNNAMMNIDDSPIAMPPSLIPGTDYLVYVCIDGYLVASANPVAPDDYLASECRVLGGFHYSAVAENTTLESGQFATSGQDVVWSQAMLDDIKGINKYSVWDLRFRPACTDPRGMVYVPELRIWVDIYFTNTTYELGTSRHGSNVASGTVLPLKPLSRGGNGVATYPRFGWWEASEVAAVAGKRLLTEREFNNSAIGVTENISLGGASETIPTSQFEPRFTSIYGLHQVTGCHWTWGEDHGQREMNASSTTSTWGYRAVTGAPLRGQIYTETGISDVRVILGGNRTSGGYSGSRAASWGNYPWTSYWSIGLRAASDHLHLV